MSSFQNTILITGGTTGLGYHCAHHVAQLRPECQVLIASRTNLDDAASSINKSVHQSNVEYLPLDLGSLSDVRAFVSKYETRGFPPITALVMNAGLQFPYGVSYTGDGVEKTFGINHVGHALLFYLLRPQLAANARIVVVASGTHDPAQKTGVPDAKYTSAEELAHPTAESAKNNGRQRYSTSKLCNVMWSYALHRHLLKANQAGKQWTVNAMDPGLMPGTKLARDAGFLLNWLFINVMPHLIGLLRKVVSHNIHPPQESGAALARLAVGDDVSGVSGKYFEGMKEIKSSTESYVEEKQDDLWDWTARFVAKDQEDARAFENLQ